MRVGVPLLRAVEHSHALGGHLVAQVHATQEFHCRVTAGMDVEPFVQQASSRHCAEAQFPALIPSNISGHKSWTSAEHCCMPHLLHWSNMSMNQSRTMGSTWILQHFGPLPLGCLQRVQRLRRPRRHRECWCGRSPPVRAVGRWCLLVATSPVAVSGHHAGAHGGGGCASAEHAPRAGASWASSGPPPFGWWPSQTNRQGDGGPLGPHVVERGGCR